MKLLYHITAAFAAIQCVSAVSIGSSPGAFIRDDPEKRALLQNIVTWDKHSLFIKGERIFIYSGEFHPFRLPVPSLWLDIFQKIKALGFNAVSFYIDWALLEGKRGSVSADGVFALEPFFQAALDAGVYLIARPGPYINAEVSGGGFPGWLQRVKGGLRTSATDYLAATDNYIAFVGAKIAKAQVTNGGPVILYQPENEYSSFHNGAVSNPSYMQYVEDQARKAGIIVPFISNDAGPDGHNAPGSGTGAVDIYGHDGYPLGFHCSNPTNWGTTSLPTTYRAKHLSQSPNTPYSIDEFQGGSFDPWGGSGFENCAHLLNHEFERVFYKNNYAAGVTIFNLYMIYGGTNWGNLGHPAGYSSYDYGSAIAEDRSITREKYSEAKLEAQFLKVSPGYLTATPGNADTKTYTSTGDLTVTPIFGSGTSNFYVLRHTAYESLASTSYTLKFATSAGTLTIPQLGGTLSLNGRDSKIHVTDYDIGGINLVYSTAEIFTWKKTVRKRILFLYGGLGEQHEAAITTTLAPTTIEGSGVITKSANGVVILHWQTSGTRRIVQLGNLFVYLLDRNSAYNYWVPDLPVSGPGPNGNFGSSATSPAAVVIKAGYLVRGVSFQGTTLNVIADFNATTPVEVISGQDGLTSLSINGHSQAITVDKNGVWSTTVIYSSPGLSLPNLNSLTWSYTDGLPEIRADYDDSAWTKADKGTSNSYRALTTPTSLYSSDYGYNTGYLLYRGHFTSTGSETTFLVNTQGGAGFGSSVWLDGTYLGSWTGTGSSSSNTTTYNLPKLTSGSAHVLTVLIDNMGLDENWSVGDDTMKNPRGILDYTLAGHSASSVAWKLTGNLGGESYIDKTRGPLNEGGLHPEREGYHQPSPPSSGWAKSSPTSGISSPGVGFYSTSFNLNLPAGYDIPLHFVFSSSNSAAYRVQLYVNGYQFGKYTNNIGPQKSFPVPQGVLNYSGSNTVAVTLWGLQGGITKLEGLSLVAGTPVASGFGTVTNVAMPAWTQRANAY